MRKTRKKCPLCQRVPSVIIKNIKGINILQCDCQLAILEKNIPFSAKKLYSLKNYLKESLRLEKRFNYLASIVTSFIKKGEVLDIGSGFGLFSSILDKKGKFQFLFIDKYIFPYLFKDHLHSRYKKEDYLEFVKKNKKKFDLILMFDILEHFSIPHIVLKKTRNILKEEGFLVIQTPNYKSLMAKICQNWSWWMVEDHKVIFSPDSLKRILKKTGYKIVYFRTYEDWIDFKKNLDGNFSKIRVGYLRKIVKLFFYLVFFPVYFLLRNIFWNLGRGGLIFLIAQKNKGKIQQ